MKPGTIVLVRFPFSNLQTTKQRPALVLTCTKLARKPNLLTIAMITSQIDGIQLAGDVALQEWEKATLLHPSLVRLAKIATIAVSLVHRILGKLSSTDIQAVRTHFTKPFGYWLP